MELKELDCPFCDMIGDWSVDGVEFVDQEVYLKAKCPNPRCKKEVVISVPLLFNRMRMFTTPKSKSIRAEMIPADKIAEKSEPSLPAEQVIPNPARPKTEAL